MKNRSLLAAALLSLGLVTPNCTHPDLGEKTGTKTASNTPLVLPPADPNNYWYQGKAELATYDVEQERYGEIRAAQQVMVFVTEDFSYDKQVKLDNAQAAGEDRVPVLKLNTVRHFTTGIYDYSLMQSVFTPINGTATLKTTTTVQDWCGHVFQQINFVPRGDFKDPGVYRVREFSYFESEGDFDITVPGMLLEDEIWTCLRLDPDKLIQGVQDVLPGAFYLRLRHKPCQAAKANLTLTKTDKELTLNLAYQTIPRQLTIVCEALAPHRVLRWEETDNGKLMTKGTLKALRLEPYWQQNSHQFDGMRDSLLLRPQ